MLNKTTRSGLDNPDSSAQENLSATATEKAARSEPAKKRNLNSGMELLELDFLLSIIENTEANDERHVTMRKLTFHEALRREDQNHIDSNALTVYAVNKGNLFDKTIQCEAIKELTKRTVQHHKAPKLSIETS
ncbi:MAG: hypothetical protein ACYSSL_00405 [Planctomycetota bacterium]|jgi:hypothetical protein